MTPPTLDTARVSTEAIVVALARERRRVAADLIALTKPRVVLMILVTTVVGYYVGLAGAPDYARLVHLLVGTLLAAGGTLALNQYWERDVDARMERTRVRPLPEGRLAPLEALLFGTTVTVAGLVYLGAFVSPLVMLVTAATTGLYLFAYTPLKLRTPLCTIVGAVPGALPPVAGWVASREDLGVGAWVLFGIMFLWQLPHTLAIARLYRDDYARAGVRLLPVVDAEGTSTERQIVTGCLALLAVSLLPTLIGLAGPIYFVGAFVLGTAFVALGARQALWPSAGAARRVRLAMLFLICGEVMFFGGLVSAFLVLRVTAAQWPPPLQPRLPVGVTGVNTLVLLASSVAMVAASRALGRDDTRTLVRRLLLAAGLGLAFLLVQGYEWIRLVSYGLTVWSGAYGTTFYTLIGMHAAHVVTAVTWVGGTAWLPPPRRG